MNIAHILGSLGMGGAERVALDLATLQNAQGHRVVVISLAAEAGGALYEEFTDAGVPVVNIAKRPGIDWRLPGKIARYLRREKFRIVHTHNTQPLVYAAAAARLAGTRVVHTKHGRGHLVSRAGQILRRAGGPFVHEFVAVSQSTAQDAIDQKAYPWPAKIRVIDNGIPTDKFGPNDFSRREIRKELGISDRDLVIGSIGRVDDNKNHVALIRASEFLLERGGHLLVAGDGDAMGKLVDAKRQSSAPERIHLLGRRNDAAKILSALDIFALPSLSEGLPLVILEAMASELAVVSSDVGGIGKVIRAKENGLLIPPGDEAALSLELQTLCGDAELRSNLGKKARELVVENYSAERMNREYMKLYQ